MKELAFSLLALSALAPGVAQAQQEQSKEIRSLRSTVEQQSRTIRELMRRLNALEAGRDARIETRADPAALSREIDQLEAALSAGARIDEGERKPQWTDWVKIKGNFRYRYEAIDDGGKDYDRHRNRIRARIGVFANPWPNLDLGFEITSGEAKEIAGKYSEGDPKSNNQTLGNAFSLKNLWISQAYFSWHPDEALPGLSVQAGKIKRPFFTPAKHELVWDSDVNPEGVLARYESAADGLEMALQAFGFWVKENKDTADSGLFGGQASFAFHVPDSEEDIFFRGVLGYYDYGNVQGEMPLVDGKSFGNTTNAAGELAKDFNTFEVFGETGMKIEDLPVALQGGWVKNTATGDEDQGWQAGFTLGKAKEAGSWWLRYLWRTVENDAIFGTFADSDFGGGSTSARGHELNLVYAIAKNWTVAASIFANQIGIGPGENDHLYRRFQLDMYFKF